MKSLASQHQTAVENRSSSGLDRRPHVAATGRQHYLSHKQWRGDLAAHTSHTIEDHAQSGDGRCGVVSVWIVSAPHDAERVVSFPHLIMGNSLTVTEKEHWKNRIAERIEKRIETLFADDPEFLERIREQAQTRALDSLGIRKAQERLDLIEKQEERLDARKDRTRKEMFARIRNVPIQQVADYRYGFDAELKRAIEKRQAVHEDELLADTELGREILSLRLERPGPNGTPMTVIPFEAATP